MLIWTEAYHPFIMGGDVNAPIATEVEVGEKIHLGKGFYAHTVVSPVTGDTHVIEAESGALIGTDVQSISDDIENCEDREVMQKQIEDALERREEAKVIKPDKFWGKFRK